ncbi:hypothetical protein BJ508DRAFT_336996 [Ascobolus immersus RN42]|uniref:Uncharacterized protein n=1 Tax=Ascobolus immersus RN42 TaxID=1160509 RepID=A0A3N4H9E9_ASCIM|nr:hypothetical protein BJ508DRAFT_336996 [Ascobolus immersus RN42]
MTITTLRPSSASTRLFDFLPYSTIYSRHCHLGASRTHRTTLTTSTNPLLDNLTHHAEALPLQDQLRCKAVTKIRQTTASAPSEPHTSYRAFRSISQSALFSAEGVCGSWILAQSIERRESVAIAWPNATSTTSTRSEMQTSPVDARIKQTTSTPSWCRSIAVQELITLVLQKWLSTFHWCRLKARN